MKRGNIRFVLLSLLVITLLPYTVFAACNADFTCNNIGVCSGSAWRDSNNNKCYGNNQCTNSCTRGIVSDCNSCGNCSTVLMDNNEIARLVDDVSVNTHACINITASNTVLTCAGRTITDDNTAFAGINISVAGLNNITIQDCSNILSFTRGVEISPATYNITIDNNSITSAGMGNDVADIYINNISDGLRILNNTFFGPSAIIFKQGGFTDVIIENNTCSNDVTSICIDLGTGNTSTTGVNITNNLFNITSFNVNPLVSDFVGDHVLFFRNNVFEGTVNLSNETAPHFNVSNIGNHWGVYNDSDDDNGGGPCTINNNRRDGENFPVCDEPYNLTRIPQFGDTLRPNFANDSFPRVTIFGGIQEFTAPSLVVNFPENLTNISSQNVTLNITVSDTDSGLDQCWYSLNSTEENVSFTCLANSSFLRNDGSQNITVYANDSQGNLNISDLITFTVDLTPPSLEVTDPLNDSFFLNINRSLNVSVSDSDTGVDSCFYSLNGGLNISFSCTLNTTFLASAGNSSIIVYANNTAGGINESLNISFSLADTEAPNLTVLTISNLSNLSSENITLDSFIGDNYLLDRCWYQVNSTGENISFDCLLNTSFLSNDGSDFNVTVYANDTSNNINSSYLVFGVDTVIPSLTVLEPENDSQEEDTDVNLNVSVSDSGLGINNCYYSLDHAANVTFQCLDNVTISTTESLHNVTVYTNDTAGNVNVSDIIVFNVSDVVAPRLEIIHPGNLSNHSLTNITFNYTITDGGTLDICWYQVNSTGLNVSLPCTANSSFLLSVDGLHNITLYANDTQGNFNLTNPISFTLDTTGPALIVSLPANNTILSSANRLTTVDASHYNFSLNVTVTDSLVNIDQCWYSQNSTGENTSFSCLQNTSFTAVETDFSKDERINFTIYSNDTLGNVNFSDLVVVRIDVTTPAISVENPVVGFNSTIANVTLNFSATDTLAPLSPNTGGSGVDECWFDINQTGDNTTLTSLGCSSLNTTFLGPIGANHNVTVFANDSAGNLQTERVRFTVDNEIPELNITFPLNGTSVSPNSVDGGTGNYTLTFNITETISGVRNCTYDVLVEDTLTSGLQNGDEILSGSVCENGNVTFSVTTGQNFIVTFTSVFDYANNQNTSFANVTFEALAASTPTSSTTTTTTKSPGGEHGAGGGGGGGPPQAPTAFEKLSQFFIDAPFTKGPAAGDMAFKGPSFVGAQGPALGYMGPGMFFTMGQAMASFMTPQEQQKMMEALAKGEIPTVKSEDLLITKSEKISIPVAVPAKAVAASSVKGSISDGGGTAKVSLDEKAGLELKYTDDEGFKVPKVDLDFSLVEYGFEEPQITHEDLEKVDLGLTGITGAAIGTATSGATNIILSLTLIGCIAGLIILFLLEKK